MQWLKDFINQFFSLLYEGFLWLVEGIGEVVHFLIYTLVDGILTVIHLFASTVDLSAVAFNMAAQYSSLPTQLIWIINQVNFPQFVTYISGAIVIRMIINLIPTWATRV